MPKYTVKDIVQIVLCLNNIAFNNLCNELMGLNFEMSNDFLSLIVTSHCLK